MNENWDVRDGYLGKIRGRRRPEEPWSEPRYRLLTFYFRMEADLERILVESIQLETENITLKKLIRSYNSMPDMQDQLKNMVHYNQQVYYITYLV